MAPFDAEANIKTVTVAKKTLWPVYLCTYRVAFCKQIRNAASGDCAIWKKVEVGARMDLCRQLDTSVHHTEL